MKTTIEIDTEELPESAIFHIAKEQYNAGEFWICPKTGKVSFFHPDDSKNIRKEISIQDLVREVIEAYEGSDESIASLRKIVIELANEFNND